MAEKARKTKSDETDAEVPDPVAADVAAELGGVAAEVTNVAGDLRSAAVEQGRQFLEDAKLQATSYADQRKNEAAESVSGIASSLRETGKTFGDRTHIQGFVDSAADGLETLAAGLRERSFAELYGEAEAYARRSPVAVGAVAAAAGFLLARFIKASTDEMSESSAAARTARNARQARAARARAADADV